MSIAQLTGIKRATTAPPPGNRRMIVNVMGKEKQGKTNFSLTAPGPIIVDNYDYGLEGVVEKFAGNKAIYVREYRLQEIAAGHYVEVWEKAKKGFIDALKDAEVRTLVADTGTEMWELVRMARFGKLTQVMPHNYGPVNAEMRGLIREAYSSGKNLILLHKMTQEYVNEKPTKNFVMSGFKDVPYSVQVNMLCWRDDEGIFHGTVTDCRQNAELANFDLVGDMVNFATLGTLVYPGTTEDDWT